MRLYRDLDNLPVEARGAVVALGNFDGVHLGHRALLAEAAVMAGGMGSGWGALTFEPHPRKVLQPNLPPQRLETVEGKLRHFREAGAGTVYLQRFTAGFSQMRAERFIQEVLVDRLGVSGVVTGENFLFGHGRGGDRQVLAEAAARYGFAYSAVSPVEIGGAPCSSSRVRAALAGGDMQLALALLGREYRLTRPVLHGDKRGRELGVPTANLAWPRAMTPAYGIYAVRVRLPGETQWREAVANFGLRPMWRLERPLLEVHILGFTGDLYGQKLEVAFAAYLREERHFGDMQALRQQMGRDMEDARRALRRF